MKVYTKKDIQLTLGEGKRYSKKDIILKEDSDTAANVNPTTQNASSSNVSTDLSDAAKDFPSAKKYEIDLGEYSGNNNQNNQINLSVTGNNPQEAGKQIQQQMKNPVVKQAIAQGQDVKATYVPKNKQLGESKKERIAKLRESSVAFTKSEMIDFLKRI